MQPITPPPHPNHKVKPNQLSNLTGLLSHALLHHLPELSPQLLDQLPLALCFSSSTLEHSLLRPQASTPNCAISSKAPSLMSLDSQN